MPINAHAKRLPLRLRSSPAPINDPAPSGNIHRFGRDRRFTELIRIVGRQGVRYSYRTLVSPKDDKLSKLDNLSPVFLSIARHKFCLFYRLLIGSTYAQE